MSPQTIICHVLWAVRSPFGDGRCGLRVPRSLLSWLSFGLSRAASCTAAGTMGDPWLCDLLV